MRKEVEAQWFIRSIAEGDSALDASVIKGVSTQMGLKLCEEAHFCVAVRYADPAVVLEDYHLLRVLYNACLQCVRSLGHDVYCYMGAHFSVVMVVADQSNCVDTVDRLYQIISKHSQREIRIGVGKSYQNIEKLSYSRVEAYEALSASSAETAVSYIEDIYALHNLTTRKLEWEKHKAVDLFKAGNLTAMMESMTSLVEKIRIESPVREGMPYPTSIRRTILEVLVEIMHISSDMGVDVEAVLGYQDPYTRVFALQDTPEILEWFLEVVKTLRDCIDELDSKKERNMLRLAKKCIEEHIGDPQLSLSLVSDRLGITPTYFSAFFIREVGVGFNEYITGLRIEQAKHLLSSSNQKISKIACVCGFRSSSYFTVVFRKQVGISPGEYRNKKL